jgi:hypothetical protein
MSLLARLLRRERFSVSLDRAGPTFLYSERGRRMRVLAETMPDGFAIYLSSIGEWDTSPNEALDEPERFRIAENIRQYCIEQGLKVYLS